MHFLQQHEFWSAVVGYWVYSAAVSAMPPVTDKSGPGYVWLHGFLHTIAGNLSTTFGSKIPGGSK